MTTRLLSNFWTGRRMPLLAMLLVLLGLASRPIQAVEGWLSWRGPTQHGFSSETGLPEKLSSASDALWSVDFPGQSTPVLANGRLYILGYKGEGADLQEGIACVDAETGELLWKKGFTDFLSDTIYLRYATASPAIDPETGTVYMQGTQGILTAFTPEGKQLWEHSLMEKLGRLTFPNSRTATPLIDRDLVITRGITSNWGDQGQGGDRFYAFDKLTGEMVWASTPGDRPRDNSFSHPFLTWYKNKRVFIAATGDGSVVCANARTGEPLWRVPLFKAGINATVVVHNNDKIIATFGTPYEPGEMVAFRMPNVLPDQGQPGPVVLEREQVQMWANELSSSTSSPILAGDRVYIVREKGDLCAVEANTGKVAWRLQIGIEQRNSCPLFADGRLYVPMLDDPAEKEAGKGEAGVRGAFYIVKPGDAEATILSHISLDGRCFGTPAAWNGKIYVQTTKKIYCFGKPGNNPGLKAATASEPWPKAGPPTQLQIIPYEVLAHPGKTISVRARKLDANGLVVEEVSDVASLKWEPYIPPTALVKAKMDASFDAQGRLVASPDAKPSAGRFVATLDGLKGYMRGRVMANLPIKQDFESFSLAETTTNQVESPTPFAYPPLPWIGARFRFEVREKDGSKVLTKTIDNKFFQRGSVFIGDPSMRDYTVEAEVMSEGSRRKMSEVGLVNQRYLVILKGNAQELEVNSNQERLKVAVPFRWNANEWYHLKSRVDLDADGKGVVRAKAWKRGDPEPAAWTIEVPHQTAHAMGSPGLFAFAPQDMRVHIDNVSVVPNRP